jgi:hypothetical protein
MKRIEITNELMRIKSGLIDTVQYNLRKLPKETAERLLTDIAQDIDCSFYALSSLTNAIVRDR